jgi:hypothetical protein
MFDQMAIQMKQEIAAQKNTSTKKEIQLKFIDWIKSSSSHGFPNLARAEKILVKIIWAFSLLVATALCGILCVQSFIEYFQFETTSKIDVIYESYHKFPLVSVCQTNYFPAKSKAQRLVFDYFANLSNRTINSMEDFERIYDSNNVYLRWNPEYIRLKYALMSTEHYTDAQRQSIGYNFSQFAFVCSFNFENCKPENIEWYFDLNYGNCYRIKNYNQYEEGRDYALSLRFFIGNFEDKFYTTFNDGEFKGVQISIDNQTYFPVTNEHMINLKEGTCTFISLKKTIIKDLPSPYSSCQSADAVGSFFYEEFVANNKSYTQKACMQFCKQKKMIDNCACFSYYYPKIGNSTPCLNKSQIECTYKYMRVKTVNTG